MPRTKTTNSAILSLEVYPTVFNEAPCDGRLRTIAAETICRRNIDDRKESGFGGREESDPIPGPPHLHSFANANLLNGTQFTTLPIMDPIVFIQCPKVTNLHEAMLALLTLEAIALKSTQKGRCDFTVSLKVHFQNGLESPSQI